MKNRILLRSTVLFLLVLCIGLALQDNVPKGSKINERTENSPVVRNARQTRRPGFFRTLFSVIFEQWNDTRNTFGTVNKLVNENILPDNAPTTPASNLVDANASASEAPYRVTRSELLKILRRNLRGLQRLYNLELQDALKESEKYRVEFRKNASREISKFL